MSRSVICRSNCRIWSEVMRSIWFQKFWEESRAGSTGSRRVRMVRRYQSARCTLLVGATARLRAASRRYWPQDRPWWRLGIKESSKGTRSRRWAMSHKAAMSPQEATWVFQRLGRNTSLLCGGDEVLDLAEVDLAD